MKLSRRSDEDLLSLAPQSPDAFGAFYRRHVDDVLRFFIARTHEPESAADLMAETFAAALLSCERYQRDAPAAAWLYAIARNKLIDSVRRGKVQSDARRALALRPLQLDEDDLASLSGLPPLEADAPGVLALLAELPIDQRDAIRARVLEERGYPQIASELECSEAVVRKRVSRALRALRNRLQEAS